MKIQDDPQRIGISYFLFFLPLEKAGSAPPPHIFFKLIPNELAFLIFLSLEKVELWIPNILVKSSATAGSARKIRFRKKTKKKRPSSFELNDVF